LPGSDDVTADDVTRWAALSDAVTLGHAPISDESVSCSRYTRQPHGSGFAAQYCKFHGVKDGGEGARREWLTR